MTLEKPLRFACDRCHAQKLRCPRQVDPEKNRPDEPCSRCRKAEVPCVVSERGKVGRPAKVTKRKASPPVSSSRSSSTSSVSYRAEAAAALPPVPAPIGTPTQVFGFSPASTPPSRGLSPARTVDDQIMCDDYTFYDTHNAMMTPMAHLNDAVLSMASVSSEDSNEWASHSNWSDTTSVHGHMSDIPYQRLGMDSFDVHLDMTPFGTPELLDVTPDLHFLSEKPEARHPSLYEAPRSTPAAFTPPPPTSTATSASASSTSGTACFYKLTTLNAKILQFLENYRTMPLQDDCSAVSMNQLTKEVVEFSGELIEIARQVIPHITALQSFGSSASSGTSTPSLEEESKSRASSRSSSVDDLSFFELESMLPSIPQSSIVFLLLGCYTQLLHSFDFTIHCLYKRHSKSDHSDVWKHPDTVDSMLKASLAIHTITYLLDCVHRAFSGAQPEQPDLTSFDLGESSWKSAFWGNTEAYSKDGLLTRAFIEIQEREQSVMTKAQHLKQVLSRFHI